MSRNDETKNAVTNLKWFLYITVLVSSLGYFVYGRSIDGALGMILYYVMMGVAATIGFFPLVGFLIYIWVASTYLIGFWSSFTGLETTLLTSIIFGFYAIVSFALSIITAIAVWAFKSK